MNKPLLSITLITKEYGSQRFKKTLETAKNQSYENKEIIVWSLGTGPTDHQTQSPEWPTGTGPSDHYRLCTLGPVPSDHYRDAALKQAHGKYIAFMSEGDEWFPDKASLQIAQLEGDDNAAASCCNGIIDYIESEDRIKEELFAGQITKTPLWMIDQNIGKCSQIIYRTDLLRESGGFDQTFEELTDLDRLVDLEKKHSILFTQDILFTRREKSETAAIPRQFIDRSSIMLKYSDIFLLNPHWAVDYCYTTSKEALKKKLWNYAIKFFFLAFYYAPLYALITSIKTFVKFASKSFRVIFFWGNAIIAGRRVLRNKSGKDDKNPDHSCNNGAIIDDIRAKDFGAYPPFYFAKVKQISQVRIPEGIRTIKRGMFYGCKDLTSITIPATVDNIEARAFQACPNLREIQFSPASYLKTIGPYAFADCISLKGLEFPKGLESLGKGAFAGCRNLEYISFDGKGFPNTLRVLSPYVFMTCINLREVIFENGSTLIKIPKGAFYNCNGLNRVSITGAIKSIDSFAFYGCRNLVDFEMPLIDGIGYMGSQAFFNCRSLKEIQVPTALKKINRRTYYGCQSAEAVIIPKKVRLIKSEAFAACTSLKKVTIMSHLTHYTSSVFPKGVEIIVYD